MSIMNRQSSIIYRPSSVLCSTTVERALQISSFYAKQTQSQIRQNQHKHFCNNEIRKIGQLVIQTNKAKQTQFKPKQTQFKANLSKGQN